MSDWTVDTLKEYMESRLHSLEKAADRLRDETAIYRAQQNEWRGALSDQSSQMITRNEWNSDRGALSEKIATLGTRADKQEGRGSGLSTAAAITVGVVGVIGTVAFIIDIIIKLKP